MARHRNDQPHAMHPAAAWAAIAAMVAVVAGVVAISLHGLVPEHPEPATAPVVPCVDVTTDVGDGRTWWTCR